MSDSKTNDQPRIFPRNLTARASTVVRGNPANARPESGVDNCHPGLEFDQRNMDQVFFPGLRFEFQFLRGAKLVAVDETMSRLKATDAQQDIYLWYMFGSFGAPPRTPQLVNLAGLDGYEVLRRVRDLEPGKLTIIIGQSPDVTKLNEMKAWGDDEMAFANQIFALANVSPGTPAEHIVRDGSETLLGAILVGERAQLVENGVIAPAAMAAGDLTRSLCAPWQWDFADCGCHYWASNKPDLVMDSNGAQNLNFQRLRAPKPQTSAKPAMTHDIWTEPQISQPQMLNFWESLPIVIGERETSETPPPETLVSRELWDRDEVVKELTHLAAVEHALCVEYLYAHYSIKAPDRAADKKLYHAARTILTIAIDEMRHFQWVNEALILLDAPICLDRADRYGLHANQIQGHFKLVPLTRSRLNFFIRVERPSKNTFCNSGRNLDGYYTHILNSIARWTTEVTSEKKRELMQVIKLIIDEGHGHFERFTAVKALLAGRDEKDYLCTGPRKEMPNGSEDRILQALADSYYETLLAGLRQAFSFGEETRNVLLKQARRSMHNLHNVGHVLSSRGVGLLFTTPRPPRAAVAASTTKPVQDIPLPDLVELRVAVDQVCEQSSALLEKLGKSKDKRVNTLIAQQKHSLRQGLSAPNGAVLRR